MPLFGELALEVTMKLSLRQIIERISNYKIELQMYKIPSYGITIHMKAAIYQSLA